MEQQFDVEELSELNTRVDARTPQINNEIHITLNREEENSHVQRESMRRSYHRLNKFQTTILESFFKDFPHPNNKQKSQLAHQLGLDANRVAVWFQNRRTQMKQKQEHDFNAQLWYENQRFKAEIQILKNNLLHASWLGCKKASNRRKLIVENNWLRVKIDQLKVELAGYLGKPPVTVATPPQFKNIPVHGSFKVVQNTIEKPAVDLEKKKKGILMSPKRDCGIIQRTNTFDILVPKMPTLDECFLHYYISREAVEGISTNVKLREPYKLDYVIVIEDGVGQLARDYSWQLSGTHFFGNDIIDCMSRFLHLRDRNLPGPEKKTWFLGSVYAALDQNNADNAIFPPYAGNFDEMDTISIPLNVRNTHFFLMVLSFAQKKVFILDSLPNVRLYKDEQIIKKVAQMHRCLTSSFRDNYAHFHNIIEWPIEWTHESIPRQRNGYDCGAYVCFYMYHLKDLIPVPKKKMRVNETYIRIWIANQIARCVYNKHREILLNNVEDFKRVEDNVREFAQKYKHIATVYNAFRGIYI